MQKLNVNVPIMKVQNNGSHILGMIFQRYMPAR